MEHLGVGIVLSTCTFELRDSYGHCAYKCACMYVATLKRCKLITVLCTCMEWHEVSYTCKKVGKTFHEKCMFLIDTCTDNPDLKVVHMQ